LKTVFGCGQTIGVKKSTTRATAAITISAIGKRFWSKRGLKMLVFVFEQGRLKVPLLTIPIFIFMTAAFGYALVEREIMFAIGFSIIKNVAVGCCEWEENL
jgi:hypothetical protein